MKRKKVEICLILVIIAIILLSHYGKRLTIKDVAGTYKCTIDCKDYINDGLKKGSLGDTAEIEVDYEFQSEIPATLVLTLKNDRTYDLEMDLDSFSDDFGAVFDKEGKDFFIAVFKAMGADESLVSDEQMKQMMSQMKNEMMSSFVSGEIKEKAACSGKFSLHGQRIKLKANENKDTGKVKGKTIIFKKPLIKGIDIKNWKFEKKE